MLVSDWPHAIAHVDADCFFASCELARRPDLRNRPVCVLSSQDACVVAKTYDAKAAGISTGMPVWEAKKRLPNAEYIPADFGYYGQMSDKLFAILARFSPEIEVYSIDEGCIDLHGLRSLWRKGYGEIALALREAVRSETGITVSVGVSVTKTLAKIASEFNKPDGTTIVPGRRIAEFLSRVKAGAIPGIGANREALLDKFGIATALQFIEADEALIRKLMGRSGTDLRRELRGEPVFALELEPRLPKSIARTASLGEITTSRETLAAHLTHHTTRVATELVTKRYLAAKLAVFLRLKSFDSARVEIRLDCPTASYFVLSRVVQAALERLYQPGQRYRGCGVVASEVRFAASVTPDLFGVMEQDGRQGALLETMDAINGKYGSGTVRMLASLPLKRRGKTQCFNYPLFEAD
ncbi:MAG: Y-family DNA polymerase [Sulfuricella sp.]